MSASADPTVARRGPAALLVSAAVTLALLGPLVFLAVHGWRSAGDDREAARDLRAGVEYLRPLTRLTGALSDGLVSAAAGRAADQQAVRAAVAAIDAVDERYADRLGVRGTWTDLRQRVLAAGPSAVAADAAELVERTLGLIADVGAASGLASDSEPGERYLAETAVSRLPALLVASGRLAALVAGPPQAPDPVPAAVAADRLGRAAAELDDSLRRGVADGSTAPSSELTSGAGAVRLAADEMAPAAPLIGPPRELLAAGAMVAAQRRLQDAALPLSGSVLDQLDGTLRSREASLGRTRLGLTGIAVLGLLAACTVLWVRLPGRDVTAPVEEELAPVVRGPAADDNQVAARLIDARALLREVEVVRVGRAVRSAHRRAGSDE
ncbi:MAG TPA: hypothetical protein VF109_03815 [Mycobacteriales bacterium]